MPVETEHDHSLDGIRRRLAGGPSHSYLRDWVYGGIDGAVTTFAVVSGAVGGALGSGVVLILGTANLIADGFSMAASNYSGTAAERDELLRVRRIEERHIEESPDGEREEVREIYRAKGFSGEELERVVSVITSDRDRWIAEMLAEEYGLPKEIRPPLKAAAGTFIAFQVCGAVPLFPYVFGVPHAFAVSSALTAVVFFAIGSAKSRWSVRNWWQSGLETMLLGSAASSLAYGIGWLLRSWLGIAG